MTQPRIAHVIESRGPGGAETVLADLVTHTDERRFRTLAILRRGDSWLGRTLPPERQRFAGPTAASTAPVDLGYVRALRAEFRQARVDLVHAHSFDTALYSALAVLGLGIPLIATFHGASDVMRRGLRDRVKWLTLRRCDALVCVSDSLRREANLTPWMPSDRLETIHNGIDLGRFHPAPHAGLRNSLGLPPGTLLLGAVGNVRGPKGYEDLIRAMALARERGVAAHVAIAGDDAGPLGTSLKALCMELGVQQLVSFLGFVTDVPHFLNGVDAFVLPSRSEGFSLSTVQALATSLPVLVTRSGGPEELVEHGVTGLLVAPASPTELADGIEAFAGKPGMRAALASRARSSGLTSFSVETMVARYEALYDRLLAR